MMKFYSLYAYRLPVVDLAGLSSETITPVPCVPVKCGDDAFDELRFTISYYFTCRNSVAVGETEVIIHGMGRYSGTCFSTFHIEPQTGNSY
ncbi:MAG: hypothetical protein LBH60_05695 [Prevotellaceae bacterium]|nr:hypothetical protein [Prevotellaceae bacterium]